MIQKMGEFPVQISSTVTLVKWRTYTLNSVHKVAERLWGEPDRLKPLSGGNAILV